MANRNFLQIALDCISRGWYVFPCKPASKAPLTKHGYLEASNDGKQIREWWTKFPDANVAIACGASNLTVVDCDHGNATLDEAIAWVTRSELPATYTVRTGKRSERNGNPVCGLHLYYSGAMSGSEKFDLAGGSGDIQSNGDYVMAAGSIHPDSREDYVVLRDFPIAPLPETVKSLQKQKREHTPVAVSVDAETLENRRQYLRSYITDHDLTFRNYEKAEPDGLWLGIACPFEHASGSRGTESSTVVGFFGKGILFKCSHGTCEGAGRDTLFFREEMFNREAQKHELMEIKIPLCGNPPDEQICGRCQRSLVTPAAERTTGCVVHGLKAGPGKGWFGFGKISMIAGLSGSGKSYWLYDVLDDVRHGKDFLRHKITQCDYLVLLRDRTLEDAGETWMQQFGLIAEYKDFERKFPTEYAGFSAHFLELTEAEKNTTAADVIDKYARLHPEVRVIAVEGLDLWVPSKMIDPDKTELALRQLQNVAKKRGIAIIGTLGSPKVKGQDAYVGRDNLYGSTITGRMSDTVVVINKHDRADDASVRLFDVLLRKAKAERFYFDWVDDAFQEVPEPGTANGAGRLPGETDAYVQFWDITRKHFKPGVPVTFYPLGPSWVYGETTFKKFRQWASGKEVGRLIQNGGNYYVNAAYLPGGEPDSLEDDSSLVF